MLLLPELLGTGSLYFAEPTPGGPNGTGFDLEGPIVRVTTPHIPLPSADALEDAVLPSPERIVDSVLKLAD